MPALPVIPHDNTRSDGIAAGFLLAAGVADGAGVGERLTPAKKHIEAFWASRKESVLLCGRGVVILTEELAESGGKKREKLGQDDRMDRTILNIPWPPRKEEVCTRAEHAGTQTYASRTRAGC